MLGPHPVEQVPWLLSVPASLAPWLSAMGEARRAARVNEQITGAIDNLTHPEIIETEAPISL